MSIAVTQKSVDASLKSRYAGLSIDVAGVPTPVSVFIEEPDPEEFPERAYPSISIKSMGILPDFEISETTDFEQEEVGPIDTGVFPPERQMREHPLPYRLRYSVDTWHKARAGESRDLVAEALISRTPPRGYISVTDVDGGTFLADVFWDGDIAPLDEVLPDEVIYHKAVTIEVLAYLLLVQPTDIEGSKVVTEMQLHVSSRETKRSSDGKDIEIVPGGDTEHLHVRYTDITEEPV